MAPSIKRPRREPISREETDLRIIQAREYRHGIEELNRVFRDYRHRLSTVEPREHRDGPAGRPQSWRHGAAANS